MTHKLNLALLDGFHDEINFDVEEEVSSTTFLNHTTKDGETILVHDMSNQHLIRTIRLYIQHLKKTKLQLSTETDSFLTAVYKKEIDREHLEDKSHFLYVTLHKYVFEAALRGLNIETDMLSLREILGYDVSTN